MVEKGDGLRIIEKDAGNTEDRVFQVIDSDNRVIAEFNIYKASTNIFLECFRDSLSEEAFLKLRELPMVGGCLDIPKELQNSEIVKNLVVNALKNYYESQRGSYLWLSGDHDILHSNTQEDPTVLDRLNSESCPVSLVSENISINGTYSALLLFQKESNT